MTAHILALDPGNTESGYALIDADTRRPVSVGKVDNDKLLALVGMPPTSGLLPYDRLAIEMVASYGMPVGADVFETCVWIGRLYQTAVGAWKTPDLVYRRDVKLHHCGSSKAKDANITQALIDRFASGQPNRGKGTKAAPGWFYGFRGDVWQAYALAVYVADTATLPQVTVTIDGGAS